MSDGILAVYAGPRDMDPLNFTPLQTIRAGFGESRVVRWMATGASMGDSSISAIGRLINEVGRAISPPRDNGNNLPQNADNVAEGIMQPPGAHVIVGTYVGAAVGAGLAGAVNLTGYIGGTLATFASSLFSNAIRNT